MSVEMGQEPSDSVSEEKRLKLLAAALYFIQVLFERAVASNAWALGPRLGFDTSEDGCGRSFRAIGLSGSNFLTTETSGDLARYLPPE